MSAAEEAAFKAPILAKYEEEGSPYYSSRAAVGRRRDRPAETRAACWRSGISAALNAPIPETRFGVFRM